MTDTEKVCLTPGCGKPVNAKGLCRDCYKSARSLVNGGKTSWKELEDMGLAKGIYSKSIFHQEFKKRKQALESAASQDLESIANSLAHTFPPEKKET